MKDLQKSRNGKIYNNVIAENYLCVPAVLETILNSEGNFQINKYIIADYLGVILPKSINYPQIHNVSYATDTKDFGVKLKQNSINELFKHFEIPLEEKYASILQIDRDFFTDYIIGILEEKCHIVCGFEYNSLYHKERREYVGHVSIIVDADSINETVVLLDPGPLGEGFKKVDSYELYKSINCAHDGLWVIKSID